ncbi:MAG TPA: hypothetical protein VHX60_10415 [Acidobacteriaceae bacterium]|nr:hypothetical protein [Acidobacteriaceae bacterium]
MTLGGPPEEIGRKGADALVEAARRKTWRTRAGAQAIQSPARVIQAVPRSRMGGL